MFAADAGGNVGGARDRCSLSNLYNLGRSEAKGDAIKSQNRLTCCTRR
ncbi:hypothetical protein ACP70R_015697 [Stipagrostis hirtigluma subsp. patula]